MSNSTRPDTNRMSDGLVIKESAATVSLPAYACFTPSPLKDELVLLIHGYGQTAKGFADQVLGFLGDRSACAVQAPFPVPVRATSGTQVGYSWYAYDPATNTFHIPISTGVDFLCRTLEHFQVIEKVRRIIGFSQGGYVAPFVGLKLPYVEQVIGINCRFKDEELGRSEISFRIDAVNSENDSIVDCAKARASHQKLIELGSTGTFTILPGATHEFSVLTGQALSKIFALV
jgi:predicted esterase